MDRVLPRRLLAYEGGKYRIVDPVAQNITKYDIISYTWGREVKVAYKCTIDGVDWDLKIAPQRLKEILGFMADANIHYLWVDCLCINQIDKLEKAAEIAKMFQYYINAEHCHIMLHTDEIWNPQEIREDVKLLGHVLYNMVGTGITSEAVQLTPNIIDRLAAWGEPARWRFGRELGINEALIRSAGIDMGVLNCYATCFHHVTILFQNEYFFRVWTYEEMILGKEVTLWAVKLGETEKLDTKNPIDSSKSEPELEPKANSGADKSESGMSSTFAIDCPQPLTTQLEEPPKEDNSASNNASNKPKPEILVDHTIVEKNRVDVSCLGKLSVWMDLATAIKDKAYALQEWILNNRHFTTAAITIILAVIESDIETLHSLEIQVLGLQNAKRDVINGGPNWWHDNLRGVCNIFSTFSLTPRRKCGKVRDIFRGLLGLFNGLFTTEEILQELIGTDIEAMAFIFFKRLSLKTGRAWTKLAVNTKDRVEWTWIPFVDNRMGKHITSDCFASIVNLGRLKPKKGQVKTPAALGIKGTPQKYIKIELTDQGNSRFYFTFKGCNCGEKVKVNWHHSERIPTNTQPVDILRDETGKTLVQCATILGSLLNPGNDLVLFRRRLLQKLQPHWDYSDPNARPIRWVDRCVSGTKWAQPHSWLRPHNMSMNYNLVGMEECGSRLAKGSTANMGCKLTVNCGCTITAPFAFIFEGIAAITGSSLGSVTAGLDVDNRIIRRDGFGLVQVGDIGRTFSLVAFGGDITSHKKYSRLCKSTWINKEVDGHQMNWPIGRALVGDDFSHDLVNVMRDYGFVRTGGSGNLLICQNQWLGDYKIIGVCIEENIFHTKDDDSITIK